MESENVGSAPAPWVELLASVRRYDARRYVRLRIAERTVGLVLPDVAEIARSVPGCIADGSDVRAVDASPVAVSAVLAELARRLAESGRIPPLCGELMPLRPRYDARDVGRVDRSAALALGMRGYGVHLNGYVCDESTDAMWIARRALHLRRYPGLLDNLVAGGLPAGLSVRENLLKEAAEEAGLGSGLAMHAREAGSFSYRFDGPSGLIDGRIFVFDLALPKSFVPRNADGEIASFSLLPLEETARLVRAYPERFKFSAALAIMHFLLRHGMPGEPYALELAEMRTRFDVEETLA